MATNDTQGDLTREKQAEFCLEGTMVARARHSDVGDGELREPHALAIEQLLQCSLMTKEAKDFYLVNDRQLLVAFIQACARMWARLVVQIKMLELCIEFPMYRRKSQVKLCNWSIVREHRMRELVASG